MSSGRRVNTIVSIPLAGLGYSSRSTAARRGSPASAVAGRSPGRAMLSSISAGRVQYQSRVLCGKGGLAVKPDEIGGSQTVPGRIGDAVIVLAPAGADDKAPGRGGRRGHGGAGGRGRRGRAGPRGG